jgi:uncharacterized RDD family membrane protein YckC
MQQDYPFSEFGTPAVEWDAASTGQRFANYAIDLVAYYFFFLVLCLLLGVVLGLTGHMEMTKYLDSPWTTVVAIAFIFTYYFVLEVSTGRTIGKLITRTRVVMADGSELTTKGALLRSLGRMIPFDALSYLGGDAGMHDRISKTRVVRIAR